MILDQDIEVTITSNTMKYYKEIGYKDIHKGDKIFVNPRQLMKNSSMKETRICDECGQKYTSVHQGREKSHKAFGLDVCPSCVKTEKYKKITVSRRENTNISKYGVNVPAKNADILNKMINTNLKRYGVKSTASVNDVRDKMKKNFVRALWC